MKKGEKRSEGSILEAHRCGIVDDGGDLGHGGALALHGVDECAVDIVLEPSREGRDKKRRKKEKKERTENN